MKIQIPKRVTQRCGVLALGISAVVGSFSLGLHSTGSVQPFTIIEAGSASLRGDMNGDGYLTVEDVRLILEFSQSYKKPTPAQLNADPNGDGQLNIDDALRLLSILEQQ